MNKDNTMVLFFLVVFVIFVFWFAIINIRRHRKYEELNKEIDRLLVVEALHEFHIEQLAKSVKIILQFMIGIGIILAIAAKFFYRPDTCTLPFISTIIDAFYLNKLPTLEIVGLALAYSTAIDLAYTLFTPSLDEAINPLITGLAATLLISISRTTEITTSLGLGVILFVLSIGGLLIIRKRKLDQ